MGRSNNNLAGRITDSPLITPSPVRKDGKTFANPDTASGKAALIVPWSSEFERRSETNVPHWAKAVSGNSAGRCVTSRRPTPYFRPSRAILIGRTASYDASVSAKIPVGFFQDDKNWIRTADPRPVIIAPQ